MQCTHTHHQHFHKRPHLTLGIISFDLPIPQPLPTFGRFDRRRITTIMKLGRMMIDTPTKRGHQVATPIDDRVATGVKEHAAIVRAIVVATSDSSRVEIRHAVETFVASETTEHATGPVLARNVCGGKRKGNNLGYRS